MEGQARVPPIECSSEGEGVGAVARSAADYLS